MRQTTFNNYDLAKEVIIRLDQSVRDEILDYATSLDDVYNDEYLTDREIGELINRVLSISFLEESTVEAVRYCTMKLESGKLEKMQQVIDNTKNAINFLRNKSFMLDPLY